MCLFFELNVHNYMLLEKRTFGLKKCTYKEMHN